MLKPKIIIHQASVSENSTVSIVSLKDFSFESPGKSLSIVEVSFLLSPNKGSEKKYSLSNFSEEIKCNTCKCLIF